MPTTVQVGEKTLQMLNELKKKFGARSHDEVIRRLISERKNISRSMFGSNPKLKPFSQEVEAEFHELDVGLANPPQRSYAMVTPKRTKTRKKQKPENLEE